LFNKDFWVWCTHFVIKLTTKTTNMAGWGAYTTALVNTKHVSSGAIYGLDGAAWANSDAKALPVTVCHVITSQQHLIIRYPHDTNDENG
jgi:hypothetical protein